MISNWLASRGLLVDASLLVATAARLSFRGQLAEGCKSLLTNQTNSYGARHEKACGKRRENSLIACQNFTARHFRCECPEQLFLKSSFLFFLTLEVRPVHACSWNCRVTVNPYNCIGFWLSLIGAICIFLQTWADQIVGACQATLKH